VDLNPTITLKEAASLSRDDLLIGVGGLDMKEVHNAEAREVLSQHFNAFTAGNVCKYGAIQKTRGSYHFDSCDEIRDMAINDMNGKFRLHALVWGNHNKDWLLDLSPQEKRQNLINHIRTVVTHYGADAWAIDVVNEAITDEIRMDVPQEPLHKASQIEHLKDYANLGGVQGSKVPGTHPWFPHVPDYVDLAFLETRKHCSTCKLFYNDYNAEGAGGPLVRKVKSDRIYEYVMGMLRRKVPIDGVGLQFHLQLKKEDRPSVAGIKENIQRFADLGLEVHITEADIKIPPPWTPAKELEQAKLYAEILQACWSVPKCTAFIVWGLRDADSWLLSRANVVKPLLFNDDYTPKTAVPYMIHVLQGKGISWPSVDSA